MAFQIAAGIFIYVVLNVAVNSKIFALQSSVVKLHSFPNVNAGSARQVLNVVLQRVRENEISSAHLL